MKNKKVRWTLKILSATISFLLIFYIVQPVFIPKYIDSSTTIVHGYSYLTENSIDMLCLGSSQMFCTVDAGKLTDEYGISSYDFGASAQPMCTTAYYYDEAMKTQAPKAVLVEVCGIFSGNDLYNEEDIAWNYSSMSMSIEKYNSLNNVLSNDYLQSAEYTFFPLLKYHDRWKSIGKTDIDYLLNQKQYINMKYRGFLPREECRKQIIAFLNNESNNMKLTIPKENEEAIKYIADECKEHSIKLLFFKSPSAIWTKEKSECTKKFMKDNDLIFLDLHDHLSEIAIDQDRDFYNEGHLNIFGAEKCTDFLAKYILQNGLIKLL